MDETHGDRLDFFMLDQLSDGSHHIASIEGDDLLTQVIHPLPDTDYPFSRSERVGFGYPGSMPDLILRESIHTSDRTHDLRGILEALRGNEADFHAAVGDEGIGGYCAAMLKKSGSGEKLRTLHAHSPCCL